jgi:hypothetical protein
MLPVTNPFWPISRNLNLMQNTTIQENSLFETSSNRLLNIADIQFLMAELFDFVDAAFRSTHPTQMPSAV